MESRTTKGTRAGHSMPSKKRFCTPAECFSVHFNLSFFINFLSTEEYYSFCHNTSAFRSNAVIRCGLLVLKLKLRASDFDWVLQKVHFLVFSEVQFNDFSLKGRKNEVMLNFRNLSAFICVVFAWCGLFVSTGIRWFLITSIRIWPKAFKT